MAITLIKFIKGKRNHYKFPIGFYICKFRKNILTVNIRIKQEVYCILLKWG